MKNHPLAKRFLDRHLRSSDIAINPLAKPICDIGVWTCLTIGYQGGRPIFGREYSVGWTRIRKKRAR